MNSQDSKSLNALAKVIASKLGDQTKISSQASYLKDELGRRLLVAFYETADRLKLDPAFLLAVAFGEGLNLFIDSKLRANPNAKPDNFVSMGVDRFLKEKPQLESKGYLPARLAYKKSGTVSNEKSETIGLVRFESIEDAIDAIGAMVANRKDILERDLFAMGIDPASLPKDQLQYWTYVYYNAGSGPPSDPKGTGRTHLAKAAASAEGLAIPEKVIQKPDEIGKSLGNAQRVIGITRVLREAGLVE